MSIETASFPQESAPIQINSENNTENKAPSSSTYSGRLWTAIRYVENTTVYSFGAMWTFSSLKGWNLDEAPINFARTSPLLKHGFNLADCLCTAFVVYHLAQLGYALYDINNKWDENLSQEQKQELKELSIKRLTNATASQIRIFSAMFSCAILLTFAYDASLLFASKNANKIASFWADEPFGNQFSSKQIKHFNPNKDYVFTKRANRIGTIPIVGWTVAIPRMLYAAISQIKVSYQLAKDSRNDQLDQEKVKEQFVNDTCYNAAHGMRAIGEAFLGIGCIAYDYYFATRPEAFRQQNPQIVDFTQENEKNDFKNPLLEKAWNWSQKGALVLSGVPIIGLLGGMGYFCVGSLNFVADLADHYIFTPKTNDQALQEKKQDAFDAEQKKNYAILLRGLGAMGTFGFGPLLFDAFFNFYLSKETKEKYKELDYWRSS